MSTDRLWQTKLAARIHDPAEKALVLLRDPAGHENGTSRALRRLLGLDTLPAGTVDPDNDEALANLLFKQGLPADIYRQVQRGDWWAAAADRPQWPMQEITVKTKTGDTRTLAVAPWAQVRWTQKPVLVHPLTGDTVDLHDLSDTELDALKQRSFDHFSELLVKLGAQGDAPQDWRKTLLAYWRFGPDLAATGADTDDFHKLGALWEVLPADTRVPDHSIWDHLDLTSAFAGAFAADPDGEAALLALSIGPVQGFIAAARSTSDLWAGSHLLSRLAWEAMRPVCEELGPDAILFPRLRGIPQVDLWLRDEMQLPGDLFRHCDWNRPGATDANPLFAAALPNRFVAVVPASRAREIAEKVTRQVRDWLARLGEDVVMRLLHEAGFDKETTLTLYEQMKEQLAGFPEVHWAAVPFSLIRCRDAAKQRDLDVTGLSAAMAPFFHPSPASGRGVGGEGDPGFLDSDAWKVLNQGPETKLRTEDGKELVFFAPNPGVLYPAVYDLAERVLAAAKSTRSFSQSAQSGWRCSLTGETEWLTTDRAQLGKSYRQQADTLWARIAAAKPSWAKKGEHLGALPAIKRLWPTIFAEEVGKALNPRDDGGAKKIDRFVVSTHTMALAKNLSTLDSAFRQPGIRQGAADIASLVTDADQSPALPRKIAHLRNTLAARVPAALDRLRESEAAEDESRLRRLESGLKQLLGFRPETYYALLMMDGDRMGAILSGDQKTSISYRDSFHPQVRKGFDERADKQGLIKVYGAQKRAISPNRHLAVSGALNDFSQTVVRHVVESEYLGRVIYAGGDDVLAMLPVADLLPAMQRLRHAYSGTLPDDEHTDWGALRTDRKALHCKGGFAYLNGRLLRMMGRHATASTGAVIAHHQAPLGAVLRELRAAEKRAKNEGGRDAFSITVIKRSGGALHLTEKWGEPVSLLDDTIGFLADPAVSRRAVYNSVEWLTDLPDPKAQPQMLQALLGYQLARQAQGAAKAQAPELARRLAALASQQDKNGLDWLRNFLSVAEFLARQTRAGSTDPQPAAAPQGATA